MKTTETTATIGEGIYTAADAARIFNIEYSKANYWFKYYAKGKFETLGHKYYFDVRDITAVNFLTLIEMGVFYRMKEMGVKTHIILTAHQEIGKKLHTPYPFAKENFYTDGKKLYFGNHDHITTADQHLQRTLSEVLHPYLDKIEFGTDKLAHKFYPLGKKKSIVVNPNNQFGQPVIKGTNILPETIYDYYLGGEKPKFIAKLYDISIKNVKDAIEYSELPKAA